MSMNHAGKFTAFLILTLVSVSGVTATISDIEIDPLSSQYEKGSSITVTGDVSGSQIDEVTLQRETDYGGSTTVGEESSFGYCYNGCGVDIDYTLENEGEHELFLRAASGDQRKNSDTETIDVTTNSLGSPEFELKDVRATDYALEDNEETVLTADIENIGDTGASVMVRWYAERNGNEISLTNKWQYIPPGEEETLRSSQLSWQNLQDKGLELDKNYDLKGKTKYGGETLDTQTASNRLIVNSVDLETSLTVNTVDEEGDELDYVDITVDGETEGTGYDAEAVFENLNPGSYTIEAEKNNYRSVERGVYLSPGEKQEETIQLSKEPEEAELTVYTGRINRDGPENVDVTVNGRTMDTGSDDRVRFDLDAGSYTVTAAANGEYADEDVSLDDGERETIYLGLPVDDDSSDDEDATLTVNTRDEDGGELEDVDVAVDGEEFDSDNSGSSATSIFDLESGSYTIEAEKEGYETASKGVYLSPGEKQEETVYLDRERTYRNCDLSVTRISIEDHTLSSGDSTEISLTINSDREQDFKVLIESEEGTYYEKEITVDGERTITKSVSPDNDVKIYSKVEAVNRPCGYERWESSDEIIVAESYDDNEYELTVDVEDEDGDNIEDARVEISNSVDMVDQTGNNGRAYFSLEDGDYELEVSKDGYGDEDREFSIDESDTTIDVTLEENEEDSDDGTGQFTARVIDQDGDRLEEARVSVENGDEFTILTDEDGEAEFELEAGDYEVDVSRTGYDDISRDIELEEGEDITEGFQLYREDQIEINDFSYPGNVCRGSSVSVSFRVSNTEDSRQLIDLQGSGLGTGTPTSSVVLDSGESRRVSLIFTGVQGSSSERFTVTASNGETVSASRSIDVQSCGVSIGGTAEDISLSINPDRTLSNQPVKVKGYVDGAPGRSEVQIKVDGNEVGEVSTQPDGYFQSYIRVAQVGKHSISVETDSISANRELEVLPTASATLVNPPQQVFEGEEFEICANVDSQITPEVLLLRDGVVMQSENAKGEVCFNPTADDPGEHFYTVRALTSGQGSEATARIEVLETAPETSSFPEQVAAVESESGLVKAEIYNTHSELKRYSIGLEGLPDNWVSTSEKEVILDSGEQDTIYFYIMPKEEGSYSGDIVIESEESEIYRENVTVRAGGTTEKQSRGLFSRFSGLWPF